MMVFKPYLLGSGLKSSTGSLYLLFLRLEAISVKGWGLKISKRSGLVKKSDCFLSLISQRRQTVYHGSG
jgi:hypothetical protein